VADLEFFSGMVRPVWQCQKSRPERLRQGRVMERQRAPP